MSAGRALHYLVLGFLGSWVIGFLGYCVFVLYTKDEKLKMI
ncbi:MAG: hypothetical protein AB1765_12595 [Candidatus Hydrogenedentota bacterium]